LNRAVFIKGSSRYSAARVFTDQMADAFAATGGEAVILDPGVGTSADGLFADLAAAAAQAPLDFVYSVACLAGLRDSRGRSIGEAAGAPHVMQMVDHPLTDDRLPSFCADTAVLTVDPAHVAAVDAVYGPDRFAFLGFCPHAAVGPAAPEDEDVEAFIARRPLAAVYAGSGYRPGPPPWAEAGSAAMRRLFDVGFDIAMADHCLSALQALEAAMQRFGVDPADPDARGVKAFTAMIHEHARVTRRHLFLQVAAKARLPLDVFGEGHEHLDAPSFSFHGGVEFGDMTAAMRRSRLVVGINANFATGSHERPLSAMAAGAAAAFDDGLWWRDAFDDDEIALFDWSDLDAVMADVAALIDDPERCFNMARRGRRRVLQGHTAAHRLPIVRQAAAAARRRQDLT
jgi:hypothetical protein